MRYHGLILYCVSSVFFSFFFFFQQTSAEIKIVSATTRANVFRFSFAELWPTCNRIGVLKEPVQTVELIKYFVLSWPCLWKAGSLKLGQPERVSYTESHFLPKAWRRAHNYDQDGCCVD